MSADLVFNLFDLLLVAVLAMGLLQGRKHGMSGELLGLLKWLGILFGCAMLYQPLGRLVAQSGVFSPVSSNVVVYLGLALLVLLGFSLAERRLGGKLVGSDAFGSSEYYLGMVSGTIRWAAMLLVALALLNARYFSPLEVKAMEESQEAAYGSSFFPTLNTLQVKVFEKSLVGPWIKRDLGFLLIEPAQTEQATQKNTNRGSALKGVAAFHP